MITSPWVSEATFPLLCRPREGRASGQQVQGPLGLRLLPGNPSPHASDSDTTKALQELGKGKPHTDPWEPLAAPLEGTPCPLRTQFSV